MNRIGRIVASQLLPRANLPFAQGQCAEHSSGLIYGECIY